MVNKEARRKHPYQRVRLRPIPTRYQRRELIDDVWIIEHVHMRDGITIRNIRTDHARLLGRDQIREFRTDNAQGAFVLLRCQLHLTRLAVELEPIGDLWGPREHADRSTAKHRQG